MAAGKSRILDIRVARAMRETVRQKAMRARVLNFDFGFATEPAQRSRRAREQRLAGTARDDDFFQPVSAATSVEPAAGAGRWLAQRLRRSEVPSFLAGKIDNIWCRDLVRRISSRVAGPTVTHAVWNGLKLALIVSSLNATAAGSRSFTAWSTVRHTRLRPRRPLAVAVCCAK